MTLNLLRLTRPSPSSRRSLISVFMCLAAMAHGAPVSAQQVEIYSIADQIKAENDCSDQTNEACKNLFENTCSWAGESAITVRDGVARNIPYDRIGQRIFGELAEIGEGSAGYVDLDLANSLVEPMGQYFLFGQYDADFAQFNDQASLALGMMFGATINGSAKANTPDETLGAINKRRDELLRNKWFTTCMQTAYF